MTGRFGLSRPRRAASHPGEALGLGIQTRALYRTRSRTELPRLVSLSGSLCLGLRLSGFLSRLRLCPLAGPRFGHVFFALFGCLVER